MPVGALGLRLRCAAAALAFAAGCFDPVASYLARHPDAPYQVREAMKQEKVVAGMTKEAVKVVWGEPEEIQRTGAGTESWKYVKHTPGTVGAGYRGGYVVSFRGDTVSRVHYLGRVDRRAW